MKKKKVLLWFRNELRLRDIPFWDALSPDFSVAAFFGFSESDRNAGLHRSRFWKKSLAVFSKQLKKRGISLLISESAKVPLDHWIRERRIDEIWWIESFDFANLKLEQSLIVNAKEMGVDVRVFPPDVLVSPKTNPDRAFDPNRTFTHFRKKVEADFQVDPEYSGPLESYSKLDFCDELATNTPLVDPTTFDSIAGGRFPAGEQSALGRVRHYFWETKAALNYKVTRNGLLSNLDSTLFSPYLANGNLSPRTVFHELRKFEATHGRNESTDWIVFELLWRDYFRYFGKWKGPDLFIKKGNWDQNQSAHTKEDQTAEFEKWKNGKTKSDFVNAAQIELKTTGFMSNRMRQNSASYLAKTLRLDWRLGAQWFEEQLIDYDVCNNWGNWSYLAGVGSDPRDRVFDVDRQAHLYDPLGEYRKRWLGLDQSGSAT